MPAIRQVPVQDHRGVGLLNVTSGGIGMVKSNTPTGACPRRAGRATTDVASVCLLSEVVGGMLLRERGRTGSPQGLLSRRDTAWGDAGIAMGRTSLGVGALHHGSPSARLQMVRTMASILDSITPEVNAFPSIPHGGWARALNLFGAAPCKPQDRRALCGQAAPGASSPHGYRHRRESERECSPKAPYVMTLPHCMHSLSW